MERCMNEVWAVVKELPGNAQEIWNQAFQKALIDVKGDMQKAAETAWKAFKGNGHKTDKDRDREKEAKGILFVAAYGGTPEWIRLAENYGVVVDDEQYSCLVDRRGLKSILAKWEQRNAALMVSLEDHNLKDSPAPMVGWINGIKYLPDGLWIRVEWTERGIGYITRKEFGYLSLIFTLDKSRRPVRLYQANLTNSSFLNHLGQAFGVYPGRGSDALSVRELRLIKGVNRLEVTGAEDKRKESIQETKSGGTENEEIRKFLLEVKELLHLHGEISLKKVKRAIFDLKNQQEINHG